METNKTIKRLFSFRAAAVKPAPPSAHSGRIVLTLLFMLLTTATAWADTVETFYLDADGTRHDNVTATVLTGSETDLAAGTYIATGTLTYDETLTLSGAVTLILADDCKMTSVPNGIAAIYINGGDFTIYGQANGTGTLIANGSISASGEENLTINGGTVHVNVSGTSSGIYTEGNVTINGGKVTANANDANYSGIYAEGVITLSWNKPTDRITASSYIGSVKITKTFTDGTETYIGDIDDDYYYNGDLDDLAGKTLFAPNEVHYIDHEGHDQTANKVIVLDGSETKLAAGTYVALGNVTYDHELTLNGAVTLILADGCTMNVGTSENRINDKGIKGYFEEGPNSGYDFTIYGQSLGTGALNVYTSGNHNYAIKAKNVTINGGNVTATTTTTDTRGGDAICASSNVTINGGTVTALGLGDDGGKAIYAVGGITFNWRKNTDRITIGSTGLYVYSNYPAFSKAMIDGLGNIYSGTLGTGAFDALNILAANNNGLTLYPYEENIAPTANAVDDNYWTTFYCGHTGYKINDEENAWAYTAEYDGANSQLTLHKLGKVIPKNTAVILVGEDNEISMTASTEAAENDVDNDLHGVDVRTLKSTLGTGTFYVLSKKNDVLGFYEYTADYMPARKAYLLIDGGAALAKGLTMVFDDETTGIRTTNYTNSDEWYTINGVKLSGKPTKKGVYIVNGKVVIK